MATFKIKAGTDFNLTFFDNYCKEGSIELSDEEVKILKEYVDETLSSTLEACEIDELVYDAEEKDRKRMIELQKKLRPIHKRLDAVCRQMTYDAYEMILLTDAVYDDGFDYDVWEVIDYCEKNCGYKFDYCQADYLDEEGNLDEDKLDVDKCAHFHEWVYWYVMRISDDDARDFIVNHLNGHAEFSMSELDYRVVIPDEIVDSVFNL